MTIRTAAIGARATKALETSRVLNMLGGRQSDPEVLSGVDRSWEVSRHRALVGYVLIRRLGYKLKDVARCLGRDIATG
jgi:hypothetical protein